MKKLLKRKIGFGRFAVPMWFAGLSVLIIAATAGQAVGPVLSGGVQGSTGLVVEQSIVLDDTAASHSVTGADDAVVTVNDDGSSFTAAIEMHVGDTGILKPAINNNSDADGNAIMELNVPRGIDVEVEASTGTTLKEAQLTRSSWLMVVNSGNSETIDITIESKDDIKPGFYTISGRIVQVAN